MIYIDAIGVLWTERFLTNRGTFDLSPLGHFLPVSVRTYGSAYRIKVHFAIRDC